MTSENICKKGKLDKYRLTCLTYSARYCHQTPEFTEIIQNRSVTKTKKVRDMTSEDIYFQILLCALNILLYEETNR